MINKSYLYTNIYSQVSDVCLDEDSTYLYGVSPEYRSSFVDDLIKKYNTHVSFIKIEDVGKDIIRVDKTNQNFLLRSSQSMSSFIEICETSILYLDVTGLDNRIAASILKNIMDYSKLNQKIFDLRVIYAEPESYKIQEFKSEGIYNDLSEKIEGIEPLPCFATIFPDDIDNVQLIALLGFEGGRFTHILENIQPPRDNVVPVIGVPGFRLEYPFVAYWGNRRPLQETDTWRNIKFAAANSMVDVYFLLSKILNETPSKKIKIAPIGTKPHAVASMLFAIKHPREVEIVYDNPKRKKQRTEGVGQIIECLVSKLIKEN